MKSFVINKEDLTHNINIIKDIVKDNKIDNEKKYQIIAVVKGNGYGYDLVKYTKFLVENGINYFAVATLEEALELRKAGIEEKILMLSATRDKEELELLIKNNIILTIGSMEETEIIEKIAQKNNIKIKAHLKIDTGFGRYGFLYNKPEELLIAISKMHHIDIEGVFSHFSQSYSNKKEWTKKQFDRFIEVVETLKLNDINPRINSYL